LKIKLTALALGISLAYSASPAFAQATISSTGSGNDAYIEQNAVTGSSAAITQNGNTTLRVEPYGSQRLSAQNILNLKASKDLKLGAGRRLNIDVDVFNVLNAATPTAASFVTGPSFGFVSSVIPARIARLGLRFAF